MRFFLKKTKVVILIGACISIFSAPAHAEDEVFPGIFKLTSLNGNNGFAINSNFYAQNGKSVRGAGDVNGDGIDDILGQTYVVFGSEKPWPAVINLFGLDGKNGFTITGPKPYQSIYSVSGVGDANGDGIADILMGFWPGNNNAGQSYAVFGSKEPWPAIMDLSSLNGSNGFIINGIHPDDYSSYSVSGAGDVNGDSIDDILIGAPEANNGVGQSYVVFGGKELWPAVIDLFGLNGSNGFTINGINADDQSGYSVSGVGDVNGDGLDDILVGAPYANNRAGQSYVIFGSKEEWPAVIHLMDLDGNNGFSINGGNGGCGSSVSGAGDINGDGIVDFLMGAPYANNSAGQSYIVFGSKQEWPSFINLENLNGTNGFTINGRRADGESGSSVSGGGDVNGDGIDDILIGAPRIGSNVGQSYVVFGSKESWPAVIQLENLNGINGFFIHGINPGDYSGCSVSGAGDVNGDGIDDILIGAEGANNYDGQSYVIFGEKVSPKKPSD